MGTCESESQVPGRTVRVWACGEREPQQCGLRDVGSVQRRLRSDVQQGDWRRCRRFRDALFSGAIEAERTAMKQLRIVTLRFGTGRQKMALERRTNPKLSRRTL